ncbi:MAG: hypothetical protein NTY19_28670 [Planctomycetota bacterium]|nr:hypothetical protein [Planctomycetota bacterium]
MIGTLRIVTRGVSEEERRFLADASGIRVVAKLELDHPQRVKWCLGDDHPVRSPLDRFDRERPHDALAHRRQPALTVLPIEQFLKSLVQGLRQPELLSVLGQIQLYQHRASHVLFPS